MPYRFNCPPNWPSPPPGWEPYPDWLPDLGWGPAPLYWEIWIGEGKLMPWQKKMARTIRDMAIRAATSAGGQLAYQVQRGAAVAERTAAATQETSIVAQEIRILIAMRDEGLITDEELDAKRRQILGI